MNLTSEQFDELHQEIDDIVDEESNTILEKIFDDIKDSLTDMYNEIIRRVGNLLEDYLEENNSSDLNDAVRRMANNQTAPVQNNQSVTQNGVTYATTINARIQALKTYLSNQQRNGAGQQELNITRAKINELESLVGQIGR